MRVRAGLFFSTILLIFVISFVQAEETPKYLLLYAFPAEGELVAGRMSMSHVDTILGRVVQTGSVSGQTIILAESGVGMTNAAMTTQRLIDQFQPSAVIFTGIAGAIDSSVKIGDIVVASSWVQHDYGNVGAEGFRYRGVASYRANSDSIMRTAFAIDPSLLDASQWTVDDGITLDPIGTRIPTVTVGGVGASGNTFIDNSDTRRWLSDSLHALVVDMESAAVAQVCNANGTPVIVLRFASDLAGGSGSSTARSEIEQFFKVAAGNSAELVLRLLTKLPSKSRLEE